MYGFIFLLISLTVREIPIHEKILFVLDTSDSNDSKMMINIEIQKLKILYFVDI